MKGVFFSLFVFLAGCQPGQGLTTGAPVKRTYQEIFQSAPAQPSHPPTAMSGELDMSSIPDDDIHAFLREGHGSMAGPMPVTGAMDPQTQKMLAPPMAGLEASAVRPPLSWKAPEGWHETPGTGMRLVSFTAAEKDDPVECTIISLGGQAGGLESNVVRWMKQVNIPVPHEADLEQFLAAQKRIKTKDGFSTVLIDLTQLQSKEDLKTPSMAATVIELPEMTVFVKMTGTRGAVLKNREKFEKLCESLKLN